MANSNKSVTEQTNSTPNVDTELEFLENAFKSHWIKYGLLDRTDQSGPERSLPRMMTTFFTLLMMVKTGYSIHCGWQCQAFQRYSGDFYVAFGSQAIWLYLNSSLILISLVDLATPLFVRKRGIEWFKLYSFRSSTSDQNGNQMAPQSLATKLRLDEASLKKFLIVFKLMDLFLRFALHVPHLASVGFALLYFLKHQTLEALGLALVWGLVYFVWCLSLCASVIVPPCYLVAFCFFVWLRATCLNSRIVGLQTNSHKKPGIVRNLLSVKIELIISDQQHLVKQIRFCNRLSTLGCSNNSATHQLHSWHDLRVSGE